MQKYSSGRRGFPAKEVGRVTVARVRIPPSAPIKSEFARILFFKTIANSQFVVKQFRYFIFTTNFSSNIKYFSNKKHLRRCFCFDLSSCFCRLVEHIVHGNYQSNDEGRVFIVVYFNFKSIRKCQRL